MNPTTESRLWSEINTHNMTAWHAMITGHRNLVFTVAHRQHGISLDTHEELVSEGELALCQAAEYYRDSQPRCRFSTYAYRRITRAVIGHLRTDGPVSRTEWSARVEKAVRGEADELAQAVGRTPSTHELIDALGAKRVAALHGIHGTPLDATVADQVAMRTWEQN
jgi:RNA polymerase sigma factor (sigma-70 family)